MNTKTITERPTTSGSDALLTITSHHRNGADKSRVINRRSAKVIAGLLVVGCLWVFEGQDALQSWAKRQDAETLRPTMEKLANEGKDYAALWLVQNFSEESATYLPTLVAKALPEALLYQGLIKIREGDIYEGRAMIEKAADKGFYPAIQALDKLATDWRFRDNNQN